MFSSMSVASSSSAVAQNEVEGDEVDAPVSAYSELSPLLALTSTELMPYV